MELEKMDRKQLTHAHNFVKSEIDAIRKKMQPNLEYLCCEKCDFEDVNIYAEKSGDLYKCPQCDNLTSNFERYS